MLEVWFGSSWEILLDSELEPDSSGKSHLVTTPLLTNESLLLSSKLKQGFPFTFPKGGMVRGRSSIQVGEGGVG